MLYRLKENEFEKARPLFHRQNLAFVIEAVIAGNSPAIIWVDHAANPSAAFLWDRAHCLYLVGAKENKEFTRNVIELISGQLFPEARSQGLTLFKVYYSDIEWEPKIPVIFPQVSLRKMDRVLYTFDHLTEEDGKHRLLEGFQLHLIDHSLLANLKLENIQFLIEEIESCWPSLACFLENGFGFCLLKDQEIVCWCTAEYVSGRQCGIGIETVEKHMNHGYATITASAFVSYCRANQIKPHWDSWKVNLPSVSVAEKAGFKKVLEYSVFLFELEEREN